MNQRIVFMGTPAFAVASLNALAAANLELAGVVTAPDKPAGRGRHLRMSAVKERALELGLPVLQPANLKDPGFHAQLEECNAALFVVVAFRMLPEVVWRKPALGTMNLHASLLPDYRGAAPINWALINGETHTGLTTFLINGTIDTGDILLRERVRIEPGDNFASLHDRLMGTGAQLLVRTVKDLFDGTSTPMPQENFQGDRVHDAPKLTPAICRIAWNADARRVHDHIRGLSPMPGAWTTWQQAGQPAKQLKILAARPLPGDGTHGTPGHAVLSGGRMLVHCGSGAIDVLELQLEGKRAMDTASFLRGMHEHAGIVLA